MLDYWKHIIRETSIFLFTQCSNPEPKAWEKNNFILHTLGEGLISDNSEAHFTSHHGYKVCFVHASHVIYTIQFAFLNSNLFAIQIIDPKPFLAKTGPYLSILATLVHSAVGFCNYRIHNQ